MAIGRFLSNWLEFRSFKKTHLTEAGEVPAKSFGLGTLTSFATPSKRLATDWDPTGRQFGQKLFQSDSFPEAAFDPQLKTPEQGVETSIRIEKQQEAGNAFRKMDDAYRKYKKRVTEQIHEDRPTIDIIRRNEEQMKRFGINKKINKGDKPKLTKKLFDEEISKASRRMGRKDFKHPIPEIDEMARDLRSNVFEKTLARLIDNGLLPKELETNEAFVKSYVAQMWNKRVINQFPDEFISRLSRLFQRSADKTRKSLLKERDELTQKETLTKTEQNKLDDINEQIEQLDKDPAKQAEEVFLDITSNPWGMERMRDEGQLLSKFEKKRRIHIPDDMLEEMEPFLENDMRNVLYNYLRSEIPRIQLKEKLGSVTPDDWIKSRQDGLINILKQHPNLSPGVKQKLRRDTQNRIEDIRASYDLMLGRYGLPRDPDSALNRISESLLRLNLLRALGGVVISSMTGLPNFMMRNSAPRVLKALGAYVSDSKFRDMAQEDLKSTLGIYEVLLNSRMYSRADLDRINQPLSIAEEALQKASDKFGQITLISYWNEMIQTFAALSASDQFLKVIRKVSRGEEVGKTDQAVIRAAGIGDQSMINRISQQFQRHGRTGPNDVLLPQLANWKDKEAAEMFRNAIRREVDNTIVTPSKGSKPLMANTPLGRHVFQFKSFAMASTAAITMAGLQQRDMRIANSFLISMALGATVYAIKQAIDGEEIDTSADRLALEAIDRGGILGYITEASNIMERASGGRIGLGPLIAGQSASRVSRFNAFETLGGATAGTINDLARILKGIPDESARDQAVKAFIRQIPYQNLFYVRGLMEAVEQGKEQLER